MPAEAKRGLLSLTRVAPIGPIARRIAFVVAGVAWSLLMAPPALLREPPLEVLGIARASRTSGPGAAMWPN
jgi:hypothetical protein